MLAMRFSTAAMLALPLRLRYAVTSSSTRAMNSGFAQIRQWRSPSSKPRSGAGHPDPGRAVPGVVRLVGGVAAHSAWSSQVATGAPLLAHARAWQRVLVDHVKTYRKGKRAANNRSASGAGIAAGAPRFAHVCASRGGWQCRATRQESRPPAKKPATGKYRGGPVEGG